MLFLGHAGSCGCFPVVPKFVCPLLPPNFFISIFSEDNKLHFDRERIKQSEFVVEITEEMDFHVLSLDKCDEIATL